jgi:serine/threonine-protein kinase
MKAMSPKLSRRYSSAETMLHDLEEFRKNPSIIFDYDRSDWHEAADETDEPTRYMKTGETQLVMRRSQEIQSDRRARELEKKRVRRQIEQEEDYRVKKNNSLIAVLSGVLAVLLFIAGMAYLIITIFNGSTGPDDNDTPNGDRENVSVPRLTGRQYDDVLNDPELPDLVYVLDAEESSQQPAGEIIAQDPSPNRSVRPGSDVLLTVSTGPKSFTLDDYTGREYRAVQRELSQLKLRYNDIPTYQSHPTLANGMVIETRPAANTPVYENDNIELIVSSGPVPRKVEMPDLLGKTEEEAVAELMRLNLAPNSLIMVDSDKPAGTVVTQSPESGTLVEEGTPVDLSFSLGPVTTPDPTPTPGGETPLPDPNNPTDPIVPPTGDPGVTPTPDPGVTPTPDPNVTPPPALLTRTMPITLPQDKAEALVEIRVNNTAVYQGVEATSQGTIYREVTGAPLDVVYLYIDGVIRWNGTMEGVGG